jgi:hypothetical protein
MRCIETTISRPGQDAEHQSTSLGRTTISSYLYLTYSEFIAAFSSPTQGEQLFLRKAAEPTYLKGATLATDQLILDNQGLATNIQ